MRTGDEQFLKKHNIEVPFEKLYSCSEAELAEEAIKLVNRILSELEENSKVYQEAGEDTLSSNIVIAINQHFLFKATRESNSNGHVDITIIAPRIKDEGYFKFKGEAKIWNGVQYALQGFDQLQGYLNGRHDHAFVALYFRGQSCDDKFNEYKDDLVTTKAGNIIKSEKRYCVSEHIHQSTIKIVIHSLAAFIPIKK